MTGTVTLYFNTGFNGVDIPASSAVLANATQKTYPQTYYVREDVDKPVIRVNDTYENVCDVDYCKIVTANKTCYYFVSAVEVLSKGVMALYLDLDALLTMGGAANLNYTSGWQERGHIAKTDDVLFGNVAAEDWRPSQPLHNKNQTTLKMTSQVQNDVNVAISNIDLSALGRDQSSADAQTVIEGIDGNGDVQMYFPSIKAPTMPTGFNMWDYLNGAYMGFEIPQTTAYDVGNTTVKQGLDKLYSCGQLQLQASYKLPKEYIESMTSDHLNPGRIASIRGGHAELALTGNIPFEYTEGGYTPKNKKVYATYRTINLAAIGTGDLISRNPEDLYDTSNPATAPTVRLWADPTSTGKPYARWSYIKGSTIPFSDCVKGLQWANSQLVMEGASGSMWNSISTAYANQSAERAMSQNQFNLSGTLGQGAIQAKKMAIEAEQSNVNAGLGAIGKIAGLFGAKDTTEFISKGVGAASGIAQTGVNQMYAAQQLEQNLESLNINMAQAKGNARFADSALQQQINENGVNLLKSNSVVAPTVSFTPEQNLGLYGYNYFVAWETMKTLDDLKSEDKYYQRFGYNGIHRPLTSQCFNERDYYCFVQAFDINLKGSGSWGLRVRMKAINQLNSGVRVWKVLPDPSYYELN